MTAPLPRSPAASLHTDILLVEGNPLEAELTLKPFRELDPHCEIDVARDGDEALDFLFGRGAFQHRAGAPIPRLILLDLKLPRLGGLEVLRAIRANSRTCTAVVVVLTASDDPREVSQCYQVGANSCVEKPVRYEELRATLQTIGRYWLGLNQSPSAPALPGA